MKVAAVILAAGFGSRMKEYTKEMPKPLLPIAGTPIVEYTVRQLIANGISDIGMNLHFHAEKIKTHFAKLMTTPSDLPCNIHYVYEASPTGTAGGAKSLEPWLKGFEHFVLIYGDILTDIDFRELVEFHIAHNKIGTLCLHRRKKSNSIVEFSRSGVVEKFVERPSEEELAKFTEEFWVNSAIYVFKTSILDSIPLEPSRIIDIPKDIFPKLVADRQLMAFPISCNRIAIDDEQRYLDAQQKVASYKWAYRTK